MARKVDLKTWGPIVAIAIIALAYWLIPRSNDAAPPAEPGGRESREGEVAPMPEGLPQAAPAPSTWPLYRGGPSLNGATDAALPDTPELLWQYAAEGSIFQPPVSDESGIYVATREGTVVALDFEGNERWTRDLAADKQDGAQGRIDAPPACLRGAVLVGTKGGMIHALEAATGEDRWTYNAGGPLLGTVNFHVPAEAGEPVRLFALRQDDGTMHCIDFDTGQGLWRSGSIERCDGSPAVGDGFVVFGSCAAALHVLAATDGRTLRTIELGADCQVAGGPALAGEEIYSGSRCSRVVRADARTGAIVWSNTDSAKEVFTTPALSEDLVVFGSEDGSVYALDRESGRQAWRFESHGLPSSPVIANDKAVVSADGVIHVLELDTGRELWNYEVSDGITSPAIVNGMVVVGSEDGTVAAFGARVG